MGRKRLHQNDAARKLSYWHRRQKAKKPYYAKRAATRAALEARSTQALKAAQGVYDVIVIDPPWPVAFQARLVRPQQTSLPYATMSVEAIRALTLPLADVAHVWLWTTQRFFPEAFTCLDAWGLTYSCCFVWKKPGGMQPMGLPQMNSEFALYARKGPALFLATAGLQTCFAAPRGAHSTKPEEFYAMVRQATAGRRLDMFNRRTIEGFDGWGQEAPDQGQTG